MPADFLSRPDTWIAHIRGAFHRFSGSGRQDIRISRKKVAQLVFAAGHRQQQAVFPGILLTVQLYHRNNIPLVAAYACLLYTSDAADDLLCGDLGGRRRIKKKKQDEKKK